MPGADPVMERIMKSMKDMPVANNYWQKFGEKNGLPVWNKTISLIGNASTTNFSANAGSSRDTLFYIPLVLEGDSVVNGFIRARVRDSIFLNYSLAENYNAFAYHKNNFESPVSKFTLTLMALNNIVFGDTIFSVNDNRIFSRDTLTEQIAEARIVPTSTSLISEYCLTISLYTFGYHPFMSNEHEQNLQGPLVFTTTSCNLYDDGEWPETGGGGTIGGGPTGGGSGGIPIYPQCNDPQNPCPYPNHHGPITPVNINLDNNFNPYHYDSIIVSQVVTDSFPCLSGLLKNQLLNPGFVGQLELFRVFNISQYINLKFDIDWSMIDSDENAKAKTDSVGLTYDENPDPLYFSITIILNPHFIKRATKEALISTVFHESIHAYINYMFAQYIRGLVNAQFLQQHFPLHWSWYNNSLPGNTIQHNQMANSYINTMDSLTRIFYNPNAPAVIKNEVCNALAWRGLKNTTGWQLHPNPCRANAIAYSSEHALISKSNMITTPGCPPLFLPYDDSLKMSAPCH